VLIKSSILLSFFFLSLTFIITYDDDTNITSPKEQLQNGIDEGDIICREHLELIIGNSGRVGCVSPYTLDVLIQRGWGN